MMNNDAQYAVVMQSSVETNSPQRFACRMVCGPIESRLHTYGIQRGVAIIVSTELKFLRDSNIQDCTENLSSAETK
jgi:hypothetical protein